MEGYLTFQWGGVFFRWGGFIFKWRGCPMGGIGFDGGVFEKKSLDGGAPPHALPPLW